MCSKPKENGPDEQDGSEQDKVDHTLAGHTERTLHHSAGERTIETPANHAKQQEPASTEQPSSETEPPGGPTAPQVSKPQSGAEKDLSDSSITIDSIKSLVISNEFHGDSDRTTDSADVDQPDGTLIQGSFDGDKARQSKDSPTDQTEATLAPSQTGRSRMTANPVDATIASQASPATSNNDDEFLIVSQTKSHGEEIPKTIGRYLIKRLLGEGAFGRVYEAHDPQLDRRVAVKVAKQISGNTQVQRFLREARAAAKLRHPNIIPVYEYGQVDDENIIVYEYVAGETLKSYIRRQTRLPLDETVAIIRDIANGLDYAHEEGIVHRDMKPDNVLIDKYGKPHIADFGCARTMDDQTNLTIDGSILGTPMYMSPEQASGNSNTADGRTDIWSIGVMLYEMVSGERPFRGGLTDLLYWICNNDAKPLGKINPETPADIETICAKCLTRELDGRFATAKILADELNRFQRGEPILSRPIGSLQRTWMWAKRNQAVASLLATVAVTLLIGSAVSTSFAVKAYREQRSHAFTQLSALKTSEPGAVQQIFEDLIPFRSSILPRLKEQLADDAIKPAEQRRLRMAILKLETDASTRGSLADKMVDDLLTSDAGDFAVCRECLEFRKDSLIEPLWKIGLDIAGLDKDQANSSETRFRAASALALYDPRSPKWKSIAPDVTAHLTALSQIEMAQWLPSLRPIRDSIKPSLVKAFLDRTDGDNATSIKAATIVAMLFDDQAEFLVDLIPQCQNRQIPALIKSLRINPIDSINKLQNRLDSISESKAIPESTSARVSQIANLATALIQLKDSYQWHYFNSRPDNSVASQLIEQLGPAGTSFEILSEQVNLWRTSDADLLSGVILGLGQFRSNQIRETQRMNLKPTLLAIFSEHADVRVHSSARWLLQQWSFEDEVQRREKQLRRTSPDPQKNWHVDLMGNTFAIFGPIESFSMGLNEDLAALSRFDSSAVVDETRHQKRVPRRFGICTHEITIEQFEEFEKELVSMFERQINAYQSQIDKIQSRPVDLEESSDEAAEEGQTKTIKSKIKAFERAIKKAGLKIEAIARNQNKRAVSDRHVPIGEVDFFLALGYCRWLSEKNNLSSGLPSVEKLQQFYDAGSDFPLEESNLSFNGYRLPTTTEWEYACRGASDTIFPFGTDAQLTDRYAWFANNSGDQIQPVGRLKPGNNGLFDILGNASEWCLDYYRTDLPPLGAELGREYFIDFGPEFAKHRSLNREFRGGSFANEVNDLRSTKRLSTRPDSGHRWLGFRLARTYEPATPDNTIKVYANGTNANDSDKNEGTVNEKSEASIN